MSFDIPEMQEIDGRGLRFAIVASRYNEDLVNRLVHHARATLEATGVDTLLIEHVPGAAELPFAAAALIEHKQFDAIICIGVVIAGDTNHHKTIARSSTDALLRLSLSSKIPVINGILVVDSRAQAEARSGETINRGREFAQAALGMAVFTRKWKTKQNR